MTLHPYLDCTLVNPKPGTRQYVGRQLTDALVTGHDQPRAITRDRCRDLLHRAVRAALADGLLTSDEAAIVTGADWLAARQKAYELRYRDCPVHGDHHS